MRNDSGHLARSPRTGRSSGFSFRSILRNMSASANSLASTVRSAGTSVASTMSTVEDERQREQVQWAGFDQLELGPGNIRHVLLLAYVNGYQVWDVEEADDVWELVSKRDGPVAFLRVQPKPITSYLPSDLDAARPLLLAATNEVTTCRNNVALGYGGFSGSPPSTGSNCFLPTVVKFYSLQRHAYVHTLRFRTTIYAVRCSSRVVAVALLSQLYCFDAATLQSTFSVLTYPSPQVATGQTFGYGPVAIGARWLAYAANHPLIPNSGRVSPQHLTPSPGVSPSTSPANGSLVAQYAKESSKQIVAGIVTLGDKGYKTLSRYCSDIFPEGMGSPVLGSPGQKSMSNGNPPEAEHAGIVIVRDFVTKAVVSQFRAHGSPLSALCFDATGTLLITASIQGHSINVFRIIPQSSGAGASLNTSDVNASHVHLYKLNRGYTTGVIQDIALSKDSRWIVISTSKGTNHLFAISPFGGPVGTHTHGTVPVDVGAGTTMSVQLLPWWSNLGPVRSSHNVFLPAPSTLNLSIVSRIKYGQGGWRDTVSGAAAAASGRASSLSGAVTVLFHDGKENKLDGEPGQLRLKESGTNCLNEHLWVLFPSGYLIRYGIFLPSQMGMDEGFTDGKFLGHPTSELLDFKVAVEPLQIWDVCRRPNRVEREERMENRYDSHSGGSSQGSLSCSGSNMQCCLGNGSVGGREGLSQMEMRQWFLSNAEVQTHHFRPPLWAKSQISFHAFSRPVGAELDKKDKYGGESQIEKFETRVVEVRKKDLVPVFDRLKNFQCGDGIRNAPLNGLSSPSSFRSQLHKNYTSQSGRLVNGYHHSVQGNEIAHSADGVTTLSILASPIDSPPMDIPLGFSGVVLAENGVRDNDFEKDQVGSIMALPCEEPLGGASSCTTPAMTFVDDEVNRRAASQAGRINSSSIESPCSCTSNQGSGRDDIRSDVGTFHLQEEDAESTDAANTKSEDFGGAQGEDEQGEDGWEGTMFPFVED